jgi:hypothetical protein
MSKLKNISLLMLYYNNPNTLEFHVECWKTLPVEIRERVLFIVVDDGSQIPAKPVIEKCKCSSGINLQLYRIKKDIPWNWEGARNLAHHVAPDGWILSTDVDHAVPEESFMQLFNQEFKKDCFYHVARFNGKDSKRMHPHTDTFIMTKKMFWSVGGYDEDFAGWYGRSTYMFRRALAQKAKKSVLINVYTVWYGEMIKDSQTPLGRNGSEYDIRNNPELMNKSRKKYKPINHLRFEWERQI